MLVIQPETIKAFKEAQEHAQKLRIYPAFEQKIVQLNLMGARWENQLLAQTKLFTDGAPFSFFWVCNQAVVAGMDADDIPVPKVDDHGHIIYREQAMMCGGLIFHPGNTAPDTSMSVEIEPSSDPHWSIHT